MTKSRARLNHNDFFTRYEYDSKYHHADQMPERPNKQLTVRIRLDPNFKLDALTTELRNNHNMALTPGPPPSSDIVVISGIPGNTGTDRQQILQIVQVYAPNAELLPREIH